MIMSLVLPGLSKEECIHACVTHAQCKAIYYINNNLHFVRSHCIGLSEQCTMAKEGPKCYDFWWCGYNILREEEVVGLSETTQTYSEMYSASLFSYMQVILAAIGALGLVYGAFKLSCRKNAYYPVITQEQEEL